ncbi:MAG: PilC/PilY family type IV pilus protein [Marinobacter sp.]|uniref:pilus assembly protein n=1 Tax=Marinobacter sp. TaxID=50741 RepID=UPI00299F2825|nr:PilC/PilY family type IV pilus protein [Marinobacter sp.]MDX1757274.1 PilC/PilY family type IV pilus protein [Marinobacter sp.]
MNKTVSQLRNFALAVALIAPVSGYAAPGTLATEPLYLASVVDPNLMFIMDDSGSMSWGFMPDSVDAGFLNASPEDDFHVKDCSGTVVYGNRRFCIVDISDAYYLAAATVNKAYYDPTVRYEPPVKSDGTFYSDASYTSAPINGYDSSSATIDLSTEYTAIMDEDDFYWGYFDLDNDGDLDQVDDVVLSPTGKVGEAFYYTEKDSCSDVVANSCYNGPLNPSTDAEKQNFANWFSYYRNRLMASKAGIGSAFSSLPSNIRLGWGSINTGSGTVDDASSIRAVIQGVRPYDSTQKDNFYNWLYGETTQSGGTPLRRALEGAGKYLENSERSWADDPSAAVDSTTNPTRECRQAFSILMTDGYYNGDDPAAETEEADDTDGAVISNPDGTSYQYIAADPFKDGEASTSTLADVAMYYWKRDIRDDLSNKVPTTDDNPAFWQHMVTYGVGLGVAGNIDPTTAFDAIDSGSAIDWWSGTSNENKINDLLHAAVNSRGGFFSAADPDTFATELSGVLSTIVSSVGQSTGVTFNTATLETDTLLFGARFDSSKWSGELFAREITENPTGGAPTVASQDKWEAGEILDDRDLSTNPRQIITFNGSSGVAFSWSNLTTAQKDDLRVGGDDALGQSRVSYLRGTAVSGMRERDSRLGDIVHSTPVYVSEPSMGWPTAEPFGVTGNDYADFREEQQSRSPVVYVAANDGMLHAFSAADNASAGSELFAYLPEFLFTDSVGEGLHYLTQPTYAHRFYNDLSPVVSDVYIEGTGGAAADWRTILIGGGRTGAQGIYALDITNPTSIDETSASSLALWEFTSDDDARMGHVIEPPTIGLAQWGNNDYRWTAFFGNGYNASTDATGLFMLDLEGGLDGTWTEDTDYQFIELETGAGADGLSAVRQLDITGDRIIDRIYAGDLSGNMWAIEDSGNGSWDTAYKQGSTPEPLFTAIDASTSLAQPITAAPIVIRTPEEYSTGNAPDLMVLFGTGQYLTENDPSNTDTQSFYGIIDSGTSELLRADLVGRTITDSSIVVDGVTFQVRTSSGTDLTTEDGWYVDFTTEAGERIIQSPQVRGEYVFVNSIVPSDNPCDVGGSGWLMAFGLGGETPDRTIWPKLGSSYVGYKTEGGLPNRPGFLGDYMLTPRSDDTILSDEVNPGTPNENLGRMSWQELYE